MIEWLIVILLVSLVVCIIGIIVVPFISDWRYAEMKRRFEERKENDEKRWHCTNSH